MILSETSVLKLGGAAMAHPALLEAALDEAARLHRKGSPLVLVHGGGSQVSEIGRRLGLEPRFVDGLRVTDDETMAVAQMVQVGRIARDLAASLARRGVRATGVSGQDGGGWLRADRKPGPVDLGRVGEVTDVDTTFLGALLGAGLVPIVSPVAVDRALEALNVNADEVAAAVAAALRAKALLYLSDVDGIRGPDGRPARDLSAASLASWLAAGVVTGGMIPKARACLDALAAGVSEVVVGSTRVVAG